MLTLTAVLDRPILRNLLSIIGGSFLIALFAQISIPLPFTPIPIAFQSIVCLLLGVLLGSRNGALAVLAYLFQGCMGLPVFAMGSAGIAKLLGPTGGYLIGYLAATWLTGYLVERFNQKSLANAVAAMAVGTVTIYLCGLPQLSLFVGIKSVFSLGMFPFLIGDGVKLALAYQALKSFRYLDGR